MYRKEVMEPMFKACHSLHYFVPCCRTICFSTTAHLDPVPGFCPHTSQFRAFPGSRFLDEDVNETHGEDEQHPSDLCRLVGPGPGWAGTSPKSSPSCMVRSLWSPEACEGPLCTSWLWASAWASPCNHEATVLTARRLTRAWTKRKKKGFCHDQSIDQSISQSNLAKKGTETKHVPSKT